MRRNSVLLVSLLLVAAGVLAPVGVGAQSSSTDNTTANVVTVNGSANYAQIPEGDVRTSGYVNTGLDISTAFAGDTGQLQATHATLTFEQTFRRADAQSERTAVVRNVVDRLERRTRTLSARDRTAAMRLSNGTVTVGTFAQHRAQLHAETRELEGTRERIIHVADTTTGYTLPQSLQTRLANLEGELAALQGPVSDTVQRAAAGTSESETVYVETSTDGYTMAYVSGDTYVRETYLAAERMPNATDQFDATDEPRQNVANSRAVELYPWVRNNSVSPITQGLGRSGIYRFTGDFQGGELTAYLDGGTTNVFREVQHRGVSSAAVSDTVTNQNGTLQVRVNRTYETGPMQVSLSRNETGIPVSGSVTVDGHDVGQTGDDGSLWTVEPRGPVTINVTSTSGERVVTHVRN